MLPMPLWPTGVPAPALDVSAPADHTRRQEVPALVPFLLPGAKIRPLIIVCPGGGYCGRAEHEGAPIAQWLNRCGLHAAVLQYRVWPWRYPAALLDARQAIRLVRARAVAWAIDPSRIGIIGFSAGGHLAISAALLHGRPGLDDFPGTLPGNPRPDALIACYAVVSAGEHRHDGSFAALLGNERSAEASSAQSLELQVGADAPPTFLWHTVEDKAVPVENALLLATALRRAQIPLAMYLPAAGPHGIGLASTYPEAGLWTTACEQWLAVRGWVGDSTHSAALMQAHVAPSTPAASEFTI